MPSNKRVGSEFRTRVYQAVQEIPRGRVTTYLLLARAIGTKSARAVGQALRHNPTPIAIPCHRVIRSDLSIGGFFGSSGGEAIARKLALLAEEGVLFHQGRLREPERIHRFDHNR